MEHELAARKAHLNPVLKPEVFPFASGCWSLGRSRRLAVHRSGTAPLGERGNRRREFPHIYRGPFLKKCQWIFGTRGLFRRKILKPGEYSKT